MLSKFLQLLTETQLQIATLILNKMNNNLYFVFHKILLNWNNAFLNLPFHLFFFYLKKV